MSGADHRWDYCPVAAPPRPDCPDDLEAALANGLAGCRESCICNCLRWMIAERYARVGEPIPAELRDGSCDVTYAELGAVLNSIRGKYYVTPEPADGTVDGILRMLRGDWFLRREVMDVEQSANMPRGVPASGFGSWSVPQFMDCEELSDFTMVNLSSPNIDLYFSIPTNLQVSADWYGSDRPMRTYVSCSTSVQLARAGAGGSYMEVQLFLREGHRFFLSRVPTTGIPKSDDAPRATSPPPRTVSLPDGFTGSPSGALLPIDWKGRPDAGRSLGGYVGTPSPARAGASLGPGGPVARTLAGCDGELEPVDRLLPRPSIPEVAAAAAPAAAPVDSDGFGIVITPSTTVDVNTVAIPWMGPDVMDVTPMLRGGTNSFSFQGDFSDAFLIEGFYLDQDSPVVKHAGACWRNVGMKDWTRGYCILSTVKFKLSASVKCRFTVKCKDI